MATRRYIEAEQADERVRAAYEEIEAGFGNGQVPNVDRVIANHPEVLAAAVEHRRRIMDAGTLDPLLQEFLAWATVTLLNNQFGIHTHTARRKRLGVSDAQVVEALGVLQSFAGISVVINGLDMAGDVDERVRASLAGEPAEPRSAQAAQDRLRERPIDTQRDGPRHATCASVHAAIGGGQWYTAAPTARPSRPAARSMACRPGKDALVRGSRSEASVH